MKKRELERELFSAQETIKSLTINRDDWIIKATYEKSYNVLWAHGVSKRVLWKEEAENKIIEIENFKNRLKKKEEEINALYKRDRTELKDLELKIISIEDSHLKETGFLGEKIESLQDEIKSLKNLKDFWICDLDDVYHTIIAENYREENQYTIFIIKKEEVFKLKTVTIKSIKIEKY
jgi:hypothetical protein